MTKKSRAFLRITLLLLVACAAVAALWWGIVFIVGHFSGPSVGSTFGIPTTPPIQQAPAGYKEYHSDQYRFSFIYPEDLTFLAYPEAAGGATFTFENDDEGRGFQVFAVPFAGNQITDERFKLDLPSGVRNNLQNIKVDGATGASFYSKNSSLGDTAEIWFIHGGYLYEVTTLKPLDAWVAPIVQTWKFF